MALTLSEGANPELERGQPASGGGVGEHAPPGLGYPSLEPAFRLMLFAYQEYESSLGSLNTRSGVGLGLAAAALIAVLPSGPQVVVQTLNAVSLTALGAGLCLGVAVVLLACSLLSRTTRAGYSTNELLSDEWKKPLTDFYLQQLSNLKEAINARNQLLDKKARFFNSGVASALLGLLLLLVSRALCLLVLGR